MVSISFIVCLPTFGMSVVIFALYSDPSFLHLERSLSLCSAVQLLALETWKTQTTSTGVYFSFLILIFFELKFWNTSHEYLSAFQTCLQSESSAPWINFSQHFYCAPTFRGKLLQISNYLCMDENGYLNHQLCSKTLSYYLQAIERIHGEEWEGRRRFVLELPIILICHTAYV